MTYRFNHLNHVKDNEVFEDLVIDMEWSDVCALAHAPQESKEFNAFVLGRYQFVDGKAHRGGNSLLERDALVLDYDGQPLGDVLDWLSQLGLRHFGYTTWSHLLPEKGERYRIIVPFDQPCPKVEWERRKRTLSELFPGVDEKSFVWAQVFFWPGCAPDRLEHAFTWNFDGDPLEWRKLDADPPPQPFVPKPRPASLTSTGTGRIVWETLDLVQVFKDLGLYLRHAGGSRHEVRCPSRAHDDKGGTAIFQDGQQCPGFKCFHEKCGLTSTKELKQLLKQQHGNDFLSRYCQRAAYVTW